MAGESAREVARRSREKAERLRRRAELFERGAEGESATADVLDGLPAAWTALHDRRWPGRRLANVDHVVLGPGGIFVIDSKKWAGRVRLDTGERRQTGRRRERAGAGAADAALAVSELVGPHAAQVHPVLCFVGQDPDLVGWSRDVMVCSLANLERMLLTRPATMSSGEQMDAWLRLDTQMRAASAAPPETRASRRQPPRGARPARPTTRSRPSRSRRRGSPARALVGLALVLTMLAFGPQIASTAGDLVTDFLTTRVADADCQGAGADGSEGAKDATRTDRQATSTRQAGTDRAC